MNISTSYSCLIVKVNFQKEKKRRLISYVSREGKNKGLKILGKSLVKKCDVMHGNHVLTLYSP